MRSEKIVERYVGLMHFVPRGPAGARRAGLECDADPWGNAWAGASDGLSRGESHEWPREPGAILSLAAARKVYPGGNAARETLRLGGQSGACAG